jgi:hypothetical protein
MQSKSRVHFQYGNIDSRVEDVEVNGNVSGGK